MRLRDPRNASLLILATDTVVIALIVIVLASLGVGFLIGYKVTDWTKDGIEILSGSQPKIPPLGSARSPDHEKKSEEPVAAPPAVTPVKSAVEAPAESLPKEPPPQSEARTPETPAPAPQEVVREKHAKTTKQGDGVGTSRQTETKQGRSGPDTDAKPRKPARETASARKTQRDSGGAADAGNAEGGAPVRVYTIQVGAFPQKNEAEQIRDRLAAKGFKAYVVNEGEEDPYYRVRVGKFKDKKSTEQAAVSLREKTGAEGYILVTKP